MSWSTFASLLPMLFQLISWILTKANASQETIARFQSFIESTQNDGLISVEASDKFKDLHGKLLQDFKPKGNP